MTAAPGSIDPYLFVVAAASGTGKTSLVTALREQRPDLAVSVSHTTRPMRPGERDGENYYFVERETFETLSEDGQFLESAEVFGHLYGTSLNEIDRIKASGQSTLLEIDWQGALQIKQQLPDAQLIFLLPPSLGALRTRLLGRGQDSSEVIEQRLSRLRRCSMTSLLSCPRPNRRVRSAPSDGGSKKMSWASGNCCLICKAPCQSISRRVL